MKKIIFAVIVINSFLHACTKDRGPVIPNIPVNTVSFSSDIQPIFDLNCTSCHNTDQQANNGNLNLDTGLSYQNLVGINADGFNIKRVTAKDLNNSLLYKKIDGSMEYGSNMPLGGSLDETSQKLIKVWIEEGALNN